MASTSKLDFDATCSHGMPHMFYCDDCIIMQQAHSIEQLERDLASARNALNFVLKEKYGSTDKTSTTPAKSTDTGL